MSAKAAGKPWFNFDTVKTTDELEVTQERIDEFNAKDGQFIVDIHKHLTDTDDPVEFFMFAKALNAVVGLTANERAKMVKEAMD